MSRIEHTALYSPAEAAELLGLSERHVRRLIVSERIAATNVGGEGAARRYLIHGSDLAKLPRAQLLARLADGTGAP